MSHMSSRTRMCSNRYGLDYGGDNTGANTITVYPGANNTMHMRM